MGFLDSLFGRRGAPLQLPQDAFVSGRGPHTPRERLTLAELGARHREATTHEARAEALWGLVAYGEDTLPWCAEALESDDPDVLEDVGGVLAWIGVPDAWLPRLAERIERLPNGEAADALLQSLTPEARATYFADETAMTLTDDRPDTTGLPDPKGGKTLSSVGFFEVSAGVLARSLQGAYHDGSKLVEPCWPDREAAVVALAPHIPHTMDAFIPIDHGWCLGLNNTPAGTDVVSISHHVAKTLGRRAVGATCVTGEGGAYPGVMLSVVGPDGKPPLLYERTLHAINDGGRWDFHSSGEPYPFEETERYRERRKRDRFTPEMLQRYLRALGVPYDIEPRWAEALVLRK